MPLSLVVGDEELLVSRAVSAAIRQALEADPQTDVRDVDAPALQPGELAELLSPSLFSEARLLVVRAAQDLGKPIAAELVARARSLEPEISLLVVHAGGQKGKALLADLAPVAAGRVDAPKITKPSERRDFVREELRATKRTVEEEAVTALLDAVGNDLRELCAAACQLLSDTADMTGPVTAEVVRRYHRGRAEASGFAIAGHALDGDLPKALELLRWGQSSGLAHVLVTSAFADSLRTLAKVGDANRNASPYALAGELGLPAWKVEKARRQVGAWRPEGLTRAVQAVAEADGAVKGGVVDQEYAVERMVLAVAGCRGSAR